MLRDCVLAVMAASAIGAHASTVLAQGSTSEAAEAPGVAVSGSLRTRLEGWDWFGNNPAGRYIYSGSLFRLALAQSKKTHDWEVEFAVPILVGLPTQPAGAGPQGLGANYFSVKK